MWAPSTSASVRMMTCGGNVQKQQRLASHPAGGTEGAVDQQANSCSATFAPSKC